MRLGTCSKSSWALTYRRSALSSMRLYGMDRAKSRRHAAGPTVPTPPGAERGPRPLSARRRAIAQPGALLAAGRAGFRRGAVRDLQPARGPAAGPTARAGRPGDRGLAGAFRYLLEGPRQRASRTGRGRHVGRPQDAQAGRGVLPPRRLAYSLSLRPPLAGQALDRLLAGEVDWQAI